MIRAPYRATASAVGPFIRALVVGPAETTTYSSPEHFATGPQWYMAEPSRSNGNSSGEHNEDDDHCCERLA